MRNTLVTLPLAIAGVLLLSGCFAQQYVAGSIDQPVMMSGAAAEPRAHDILKHFSVEDRSGWFIIGLIPSGHTNLNWLIQDQIKAAGGDAVINLKIETKYDFLDILIGAIVGGLYNTRLSIIEGDVIKYR